MTLRFGPSIFSSRTVHFYDHPKSIFRVIRQTKLIVEEDNVVSFYEGGEDDPFEKLVFYRKNFIFCRNETNILLSKEKLDENDPICDELRMTQVGCKPLNSCIRFTSG